MRQDRDWRVGGAARGPVRLEQREQEGERGEGREGAAQVVQGWPRLFPAGSPLSALPSRGRREVPVPSEGRAVPLSQLSPVPRQCLWMEIEGTTGRSTAPHDLRVVHPFLCDSQGLFSIKGIWGQLGWHLLPQMLRIWVQHGWLGNWGVPAGNTSSWLGLT